MGSKSDRDLVTSFPSDTYPETKLENTEIILKIVLYNMGRGQIGLNHSIP